MNVLRYSPVAKTRSYVFALISAQVWPVNVGQRRRPNDIESYEQRIYSQHGEDGVLNEVFRRLGTTRGTFVEISVGNGSECNTALLARHYGWSGLMVEGSDLAEEARELYAEFPCVQVKQAFISAETVASTLNAADIPRDFDLLSIDVDGNDYWIWKALEARRPKIVVIEYNASHRPPLQWVMPYNADYIWDCKSWDFGASLTAYEILAKTLGYSLIGTESSGTNAFFVRNDLVTSIGFPASNAKESYHPPHALLFTWLWRKTSQPS
jgi:hypothetical protein